MFDAVTQAFKIPDLRRKIFFTLAILVLFRIIASIPVPGVNRNGLADYIEGNQLLGMLNLFSGSGLRNFSIVALGVYPYITASIIMQLADADNSPAERAVHGRSAGSKQDQPVHPLPDRSARPSAGLRASTVVFPHQCPAESRSCSDFGLFQRDTFLPSAGIASDHDGRHDAVSSGWVS